MVGHSRKKCLRPNLEALDRRLLPTSGTSSSLVHGLAHPLVAPMPVVARLALHSFLGNGHSVQTRAQRFLAWVRSHHPQRVRLHYTRVTSLTPLVPRLVVRPALPPIRIAPTAAVPQVAGVESAVEQQIVDLTNQQRQQNGLLPLRVAPKLVRAAQIQASAMAQLDIMDHNLPGAALPTLQDRLTYVGYNFMTAAENVATGYPDPSTLIEGWMNSPTHRAIILNSAVIDIGVGVAYDSVGRSYYAEVFGLPIPGTPV
jgi:uncharacterized protein YkwD